MKATDSDADKISITNDTPIARKTAITINGQLIRFYKATLHFEVNDYVRLEMTVPTYAVDVVALERDTNVTLIRQTVDQQAKDKLLELIGEDEPQLTRDYTVGEDPDEDAISRNSLRADLRQKVAAL